MQHQVGHFIDSYSQNSEVKWRVFIYRLEKISFQMTFCLKPKTLVNDILDHIVVYKMIHPSIFYSPFLLETRLVWMMYRDKFNLVISFEKTACCALTSIAIATTCQSIFKQGFSWTVAAAATVGSHVLSDPALGSGRF